MGGGDVVGLEECLEGIEGFEGAKLGEGGNGERRSGSLEVVAAAEEDGVFAAEEGEKAAGGVGPDDEELEGVGAHVDCGKKGGR